MVKLVTSESNSNPLLSPYDDTSGNFLLTSPSVISTSTSAAIKTTVTASVLVGPASPILFATPAYAGPYGPGSVIFGMTSQMSVLDASSDLGGAPGIAGDAYTGNYGDPGNMDHQGATMTPTDVCNYGAANGLTAAGVDLNNGSSAGAIAVMQQCVTQAVDSIPAVTSGNATAGMAELGASGLSCGRTLLSAGAALGITFGSAPLISWQGVPLDYITAGAALTACGSQIYNGLSVNEKTFIFALGQSIYNIANAIDKYHGYGDVPYGVKSSTLTNASTGSQGSLSAANASGEKIVTDNANATGSNHWNFVTGSFG